VPQAAGALPRLAVLDVAGTTFHEDGRVGRLIRGTLSAAGLACEPEALAAVRGASKREAFRRLTGDAAAGDRLYARFLAAIERSYAADPPAPLPGARETLAWLRRRGVRTALNTGFERRLLAPLLRAAGWGDELLDAAVCGDEVPAGRPAPDMIREAMRRVGEREPGAVLVAGDTVADLEAARAAGAGWIVGVTSGAHTAERLRTAPHTHLLASLAQLPGLFDAPPPGPPAA
jgi:phosphonatase-like hydrolase